MSGLAFDNSEVSPRMVAALPASAIESLKASVHSIADEGLVSDGFPAGHPPGFGRQVAFPGNAQDPELPESANIGNNAAPTGCGAIRWRS